MRNSSEVTYLSGDGNNKVYSTDEMQTPSFFNYKNSTLGGISVKDEKNNDSIDEIGTQYLINSENSTFRGIPVRGEKNNDFEKKKKNMWKIVLMLSLITVSIMITSLTIIMCKRKCRGMQITESDSTMLPLSHNMFEETCISNPM